MGLRLSEVAGRGKGEHTQRYMGCKFTILNRHSGNKRNTYTQTLWASLKNDEHQINSSKNNTIRKKDFNMGKKIKVKIPNKYAELTKEINSDEILEGFLGFGLFADKIPNFLTSESFYKWYLINAKPQFENKGKDYVRYENMRNINIPRILAIPNPFAYAN